MLRYYRSCRSSLASLFFWFPPPLSPHLSSESFSDPLSSSQTVYSGFDTGVVSGALLSLSHSPPLNSDKSLLSTSQESWLVSSALIGALGASLFAGKLADAVGRKGVIVGAAALFALGAAEMAASQVYKEIILGELTLCLQIIESGDQSFIDEVDLQGECWWDSELDSLRAFCQLTSQNYLLVNSVPLISLVTLSCSNHCRPQQSIEADSSHLS